MNQLLAKWNGLFMVFFQCFSKWFRSTCEKKELEHFINESHRILSLTFKWNDLDTLLKVLTTLKRINEQETKVPKLFLSLKRIVYTIMQYDVHISRKCTNQVSLHRFHGSLLNGPGRMLSNTNRLIHWHYDAIKTNEDEKSPDPNILPQFSDLPEAWTILNNKATTIKYDIVPIQTHQINVINKRIIFCNQLTSHYRTLFEQLPVSCL